MDHVQHLQQKIDLVLPSVPILSPLKLTENIFGFLIFSGGIKWEHWKEMG